MKKSAQNQKGNALILIVVLALAIAAIGYILLQSRMNTQTGSLPPVNERLNPEPETNNRVYMATADPGTTLTIDELSLENDGYVYVYLDDAGKQTLIGKSELLTAGSHTNVTVSLTSAIQDGNVIYASLVSKDGSKVVDENGNAIEMQKNVGVVMGHYENEY